MKRFAKTTGVILSVVVVGSVLWLVAQKNAIGAAASGMGGRTPPPVVCIPVHGTIHSVFTTQNCNSPVGKCTVGTITDAGILDGATTFFARDLAVYAGMQGVEPQTSLSYSGQLTIVTSNGTLVTNDLGVLDEAQLAFTEIERPASGTGIFANPGSSVFFISGSVVDNRTGFQGDLTGTVCASGN